MSQTTSSSQTLVQPQVQACFSGQRRSIPAWILSLALHLLLVLAAALLAGRVTRGMVEEPARRTGIVVAQRNVLDTTTYLDQSDRPPAQTAADAPPEVADALPASTALESVSIPELALPTPGMEVHLPVDRALELPTLAGRERRPVLPSSDAAELLAAEAAARQRSLPIGPSASVRLFGGAEAVGRSFVFVIDRSRSMGSEGLGALDAAEKELSAALQQLEPAHRFEILAYHHQRVYFGDKKLVPATDENRNRVHRFFGGLAAFGGTNHEMAVLSALHLQPDVIFLLTDGGDPYLTESQLSTIRKRAAGRTTVHCIQFGHGPLQDPDNFMRRLAAQNGGGYRYVDMSR